MLDKSKFSAEGAIHFKPGATPQGYDGQSY